VAEWLDSRAQIEEVDAIEYYQKWPLTCPREFRRLSKLQLFVSAFSNSKELHELHIRLSDGKVNITLEEWETIIVDVESGDLSFAKPGSRGFLEDYCWIHPAGEYSFGNRYGAHK
jgi:hypothetical protein